jgi:hypothetical protein
MSAILQTLKSSYGINTPIQFVGDGISFLEQSFKDMQQLLSLYRNSIPAVNGNPAYEQALKDIEDMEDQIELGYLEDQVPRSFGRVAEYFGSEGFFARVFEVFG